MILSCLYILTNFNIHSLSNILFVFCVRFASCLFMFFFFFSSRRRHTRSLCDWSSDVCSSDLETDGSSTIEEMAATAAELGRQRIAITDHSKTLRITNGMDEARLRAQGEHIAAINAHDSGPLVLRSIEMDLTPEGAGDMDPETLAGLDLVLGAFHSKLRLRDDQTDRYFRGLDNPDIQVLAHPRGRIYNFRAGLSCDWQRVAHRAAETGTAPEIAAYPARQDLAGA